MFKVNHKDSRTNSLTFFTHCSDVSVINFKQVNVDILSFKAFSYGSSRRMVICTASRSKKHHMQKYEDGD